MTHPSENTDVKAASEAIVAEMKSMANQGNLAGMARYGINVDHALGLSMPVIRKIAQGRRSHGLALALWASQIHEARILAGLVDRADEVTGKQMESWVLDFNSWDLCDQVCSNLFVYTPFAVEKAHAWSKRPEEFVKRAGFVLMAAMAVHNKKAENTLFLEFLPIILREATDGRNFVKKAVNWALRQIGKRNPELKTAAIETCRQILEIDTPPSRWIARDALKELTSHK